ncbi:hypothetical protein [Cytobacillus oceanisediminis]|nr:hypothetical protein [Cytobacillus oceanisediminis]
MINTKPTPKHIENIKKYKKFLEKWDMWDFAYFDGSEYYFLNQYRTSIKGISGYLILNSQGSAVPFSQAKEYFRYLINYNTMLAQTISDILPQMKKNMSPFQERVQLLSKYRGAFNNLTTIEAASADRIINETNKTLEMPSLLNDIYYSIGDYQRKIMEEKGYFDLEILKKIRSTFNKYREVMYKYGIRERDLMKDYDTVVDCLDKLGAQIPVQDKRNIKKLLIAAKQSNQGALEKSMREFELDEDGNEITIDPTRLSESLEEKFEKEGSKYFNEKMVTKLRNPK